VKVRCGLISNFCSFTLFTYHGEHGFALRGRPNILMRLGSVHLVYGDGDIVQDSGEYGSELKGHCSRPSEHSVLEQFTKLLLRSTSQSKLSKLDCHRRGLICHRIKMRQSAWHGCSSVSIECVQWILTYQSSRKTSKTWSGNRKTRPKKKILDNKSP
jgi:hypothetical protein